MHRDFDGIKPEFNFLAGKCESYKSVYTLCNNPAIMCRYLCAGREIIPE
jgi:hypothetical protein